MNDVSNNQGWQLHTDKDEQWSCGRPMGGYRGAFPVGFLERVNSQLGIPIYNQDVLFTFGGKTERRDNWHINDIRKGEPTGPDDELLEADTGHDAKDLPDEWTDMWPAVIADPPYSEAWAHELYGTEYVRPSEHFTEACRVVEPGGHVLVLDTLVYSSQWMPEQHQLQRESVITITCGPGTSPRALNIFRKPERLGDFL